MGSVQNTARRFRVKMGVPTLASDVVHRPRRLVWLTLGLLSVVQLYINSSEFVCPPKKYASQNNKHSSVRFQADQKK